MHASAFHASSNSRQRQSPTAISITSSRSLFPLAKLRTIHHHDPKTTASMSHKQPMKNQRGILDIAVSKLPQFHWMAPTSY
jgi:hypothetical protein